MANWKGEKSQLLSFGLETYAEVLNNPQSIMLLYRERWTGFDSQLQDISNIRMREVYTSVFFTIDGGGNREHQQLQTEGQALKSLPRVEVYKTSFPYRGIFQPEKTRPKIPNCLVIYGDFFLKKPYKAACKASSQAHPEVLC